MHAWEQIQLTLDFIEEHLNEDISTEYLAGLAALSPFYYQRLFRRLVKSLWENTSSCAAWQRPRNCCLTRISGF